MHDRPVGRAEVGRGIWRAVLVTRGIGIWVAFARNAIVVRIEAVDVIGRRTAVRPKVVLRLRLRREIVTVVVLDGVMTRHVSSRCKR